MEDEHLLHQEAWIQQMGDLTIKYNFMKKYILLLISFVGLNLYAANFTLIPNCNDSRLNTFKSGTLSNGTAYTCDECFDA